MAEYVQVLTTVDSEEDGARLGRSIVAARLAACVQIVGPIRSLYWWEGEVQDSREWQLLVKAAGGRFSALKGHIQADQCHGAAAVIVKARPDSNADEPRSAR